MNNNTLLDLYHATSKHSNYQVLPSALRKLLRDQAVVVNSRHEVARWAYIRSRIDMSDMRVADIGGNTGFFSFEALDRGARSVHYYEGNKAHHDFVAAAAGELGLTDRLHASNRYVEFQDEEFGPFDCMLLLNVLHHVGDDYGDRRLGIDNAKQVMLGSLASLARTTDWLVFQLGFNWKGDRNLPLFEHGTKSEMIDFITKGAGDEWEIVATGIAVQSDSGPLFEDLNESNVQRVDALGEFLNRPLFVMRSKRRQRDS
jgi:hypothetical protein